jgi:hypothetical protein
MEPKARTTIAINANSARDRRVVTADGERVGAPDEDDGIGMACSIARLAGCELVKWQVEQRRFEAYAAALPL